MELPNATQSNSPSKEMKIKQIREIPGLPTNKKKSYNKEMSQYNTLKNTQIDIPFGSHI